MGKNTQAVTSEKRQHSASEEQVFSTSSWEKSESIKLTRTSRTAHRVPGSSLLVQPVGSVRSQELLFALKKGRGRPFFEVWFGFRFLCGTKDRPPQSFFGGEGGGVLARAKIITASLKRSDRVRRASTPACGYYQYHLVLFMHIFSET